MKSFIKELRHFINDKCIFNVAWSTKKIQFFFPINDKLKHYSWIFCGKICFCKQSYAGETFRNAEIRWDEHADVHKNWEPAKHFKEKENYKFIISQLYGTFQRSLTAERF